jgi:tetratricopeptide (TPR) repeat protein
VWQLSYVWLCSTTNATAGRATTPAYYIPFAKNRYFIGRRNELAVLQQRLLIEQDCQKLSIVGLGGTGKTQVALQFAYTVKETRPEWSIFWVPALSIESFEQACVEIAQVLCIPQVADEEEDVKVVVKQWLSSIRAGRWLLVVDNADNPDILFGAGQSKGIIEYLPESEGGLVVYTTRTLEVAVSLTRSDVLELGAMDRGDATDFLSRSLRKKSLLRDETTTNKLLNELMCLPLAIAQAAAYLNINQVSIAKYLQLLHSTEQDLIRIISKEFRDDTRYGGTANAIATTWVVSFSQIRERDAVAADLLRFMSCVEWKAIPRSLLPSAQSAGRMEEAIGTLRGYSFLTARNSGSLGRESMSIEEEDREGKEDSGEEEWYDIHRLVHLATRIWISKYDGAAKVLKEAVQHVTDVFPYDDYEKRAVWRAYLPHALRLLESGRDNDAEEQSELCLWVGLCLKFDGRIRDSVKWLEESSCRRRHLDEGDSDWLFAQHALAGAYKSDGQVKKAVELLERVVSVQEEVLAPDHPSRLASQHELARAYLADGQVKKAVELLERVVTVKEEVLAPDHPDQLTSQHALAIAYEADGQVQKAVELLERVVALEKEVLAPHHPDQLASQHALAGAYHADGHVKKAVELLEHVVSVREEVLAPDHPSRLASQHELARAYLADGQVKKAVELLERVVSMREEVLVPDHPDQLASQHALAIAYEADGQVQKAVELLEHVVAIEACVLRDDHPSRLLSLEALADMYADLAVELDRSSA